MQRETSNERMEHGWALPVSVGVHVLVAILVIFGLPVFLPQPQAEQAVSVTLEPPPKPPEEAKAAPPPPAEPAKPAAPAPEKPAAQPLPTLDPVVKFGDKDAGPRQALDGSAAREAPTAPRQSPVANETKAASKPEDPAEKPQESETAPNTAENADSESTENNAPDALIATTAPASKKTALVAPSSTPNRAKAPVPASEPKLEEVRTLFSKSANAGASATTAMANIPRAVRAGRLCATELRLQLQNGATSYFPELLPTYELKQGTVLKVTRAAFRAGGIWHNLSFECQVDTDATGIESFALRVGEPLSRAESEQRGLPSR